MGVFCSEERGLNSHRRAARWAYVREEQKAARFVPLDDPVPCKDVAIKSICRVFKKLFASFPLRGAKGTPFEH
jgi:hypothetical protein